jgi:hypothetical protein
MIVWDDHFLMPYDARTHSYSQRHHASDIRGGGEDFGGSPPECRAGVAAEGVRAQEPTGYLGWHRDGRCASGDTLDLLAVGYSLGVFRLILMV